LVALSDTERNEAPPPESLAGRLTVAFKSLGSPQVIGIIAAVVGALAALVYFGALLLAPEYGVLLTRATPEMAGAIIRKLEGAGERFRLDDMGTTILVEKSHLPRLRILLAESKLLGSGTIGNELFDKLDALSTTNSLFQVHRIRALEGELARTIGAIEGIESARVHLVMPMRELFSQQGSEARASILLKPASDRMLPKRSIEAIQQIVASSVKDLAGSRVAISDTRGNLLARGDGDMQSAVSASIMERKFDFERKARDSIERLLEQHVGLGKVRADVTAEFSLSSITRTSESFDPKSRVERSIQIVEEGANRDNLRQNRDVSVRQNIPEGQSTPPAGQQSKEVTNRTEETTNYEVSKTQVRETIEPGTLQRLSVAVMVDGKYLPDGSGAAKYEPRSDAELQQLVRLVRSVVGFNADRGDVVEVVNLAFAPPDTTGLSDGQMWFTRDDIVRLSQLGVLGLAVAAIVIFAIRPLLGALRPGTVGIADDALLLPAGPETPALAGPEDEVAALKAEIENEMKELEQKRSQQLAEMIDIEKIEGQVEASAVRRITEIFDKHPEEAVSVIRGWLSTR